MRFRTIAAALTVPAALAGALLTTSAASASVGPNPGNGAIVVRTQADANAQ